jgi:hypothetical protein
MYAVEKPSQFRAGEFPVEWARVLVGWFFVQVQAFFDLGKAGEIVRCEDLPLDLREVNLHLIQPARMDWRMNQDRGRVAIGQPCPTRCRPLQRSRRGRWTRLPREHCESSTLARFTKPRSFR